MSRTILLCLALILAATTPAAAQQPTTVTGLITESGSQAPIPYATIQVEGTGRVTIANADGRYEISVTPSNRRLKFSHIAYRTRYAQAPVTDTATTLDIELTLSAFEGDTLLVTTRSTEPGRRIILEAIKRKQDILGRINTFKFDAYVKSVIDKVPGRDSTEIWFLTETQLTSYYQKPDQYKDVIHYRRQSANMPAEDNLVYVGKVLNFNENRIDIGRYSIVSPTANDALDHYDYYLLDTVEVDGRPAFLLRMEPINPDLPRFDGLIHIADSTYDVLDVDVGFSRGVEISMVTNLRYGQRFAQFHDTWWLPVEERVSADVELGIKFPGIPKNMRFMYVAAMQNYEIDQEHPKGVMNGMPLEVAETADDFDSATWDAGPTIPLTRYEQEGLQRIDSLENLAKPIGRYLALSGFGLAAAAAGAAPDFFRFNRVEDGYLGAAVPIKVNNRLSGEIALGYAFGPKKVWQKYSAEYRAIKSLRLDLGASYELHSRKRPSIATSNNYDPTGLALLAQLDPFNYYQAQAFLAYTEFTPARGVRLNLDYRDEAHSSLGINSDFSVFNRTRAIRPNPAIDAGSLRAFGATLTWDSRPFMMNKGRERKLGRTQYTRISVGGEVSDPDIISSDFNYKRVWAKIYRRQRTLGLGVTNISLTAGGSDGDMPVQRFFGVDEGNGVLFKANGFYTFDQQTFGGMRFGALTLHHDFRTLLWVHSGIPGVKKLPFWLSIHGGALWADFANLAPIAGDEVSLRASRPYTELGFGLANLTPFANPLNLAVYFTWQLSDYGTRGWAIRFGVEL